jgi:hypothetical protein
VIKPKIIIKDQHNLYQLVMFYIHFMIKTSHSKENRELFFNLLLLLLVGLKIQLIEVIINIELRFRKLYIKNCVVPPA